MAKGPGTRRTASAAGSTRSWARKGWRKPGTAAGSSRSRDTSSTWCSPHYSAAPSTQHGWCWRPWARSGSPSSSHGGLTNATMEPLSDSTGQKWPCSTESRGWSCGEGAMTSLRLWLMSPTPIIWKSTTTADTPPATCRRRTSPERRAWRRFWTGCCRTGTALWSQRSWKARLSSFLVTETAAGPSSNTWKVCSMPLCWAFLSFSFYRYSEIIFKYHCCSSESLNKEVHKIFQVQKRKLELVRKGQ